MVKKQPPTPAQMNAAKREFWAERSKRFSDRIESRPAELRLAMLSIERELGRGVPARESWNLEEKVLELAEQEADRNRLNAQSSRPDPIGRFVEGCLSRNPKASTNDIWRELCRAADQTDEFDFCPDPDRKRDFVYLNRDDQPHPDDAIEVKRESGSDAQRVRYRSFAAKVSKIRKKLRAI